jgi:AcrR family transcriptional regulator
VARTTAAVTEVVGAVHDAISAIDELKASAGRRPHKPDRARLKDGRSARWAEHRAARRAELIEAATAAIREHGANVGMDQIARAAKTSKPVIYRYFADKADLYRAIVAHTAGTLLQRVVAALDGVTEPRAEIAAGVDAFLSMLEEDPELYRFAVSHPVDEGEELVRDYTSSIGEIITERLRGHLVAHGRDPAAARPWGIATVGFLRAAGDWWIDHRDDMTRDRLADYLTSLLWGGAAGVYALGGIEVENRPPEYLFPEL